MVAMMISELICQFLQLRFFQKLVPGSSKKDRQGPMKLLSEL